MTLSRIRRLRPFVCQVTAAVIAAGPWMAAPLPAQDRSAAIGRSRMAEQQERRNAAESKEPVLLRLHYMAAMWEKVLNDVATEANLTLVMHDTPPGRFTRNDFHQHNVDDAIRILNRDLEPLGYRLIANEKFLTVIRSERARAEYPRRELRGNAAARPTPAGSGVQRAEYVAPAGASSGIVRTGGDQPMVEPLFPAESDHRIPPVQPTPPATPARTTPAAAPQPETPAAPAQPITRRFAPRNRAALEISRDIYGAFQSRSTVQERGPNHLPAFTVWRDGDGARTGEWFVLELDDGTGEIIVTAEPQTTTDLSDLIRRLDSIPGKAGETTRLVAGGAEVPGIGKQLRPQLGKLRSDGRPQPKTVAWQADGQPATPPAAADVPSDDAAGAAGAAGAFDPLLRGNLRGEVQIQSVDGLNIIIVRGNESDVEQVIQLIDLIERMAQGSQPEIRLLTLTHVSSEALSQLLNDVYRQVTTQITEQGRTAPNVNVMPVVQPNAILILAPETAMDSIEALALALDQPADPAAEVHVFRLKHAIASQVVTLLNDFYDARPGLGTRVRVIADPRTNSLIIQARPRELQEVELLIRRVDRDSTGAAHQLRIFPLRHAAATELAEFLTTAIQSVINPTTVTGQAGGFGGGGGGQNSQQLRDTKSVVLEFLQKNGDIQRLIKSGLLTDIRISGEPRINALVITAPKDSLPMMEALIGSLDQPSNATASVKMIPLKSADALAAVELLTSLFEVEQENQLGVQLVGAQTASSLVPLRFNADARSNTVFAYGDEEALAMVEAILLRLDNDNQRERHNEVIKLRNAPAADVAAAINTFLQSQRDLLQLDPDRVSTFELLEQEVVVTPDPVNNYLIVSVTPKYRDRIMGMIRQLDSDPPQVMIQALLVEVELNDTDEFGIELGFQDPILFARSFSNQNELSTVSNTTTINNVTTTATNIISQSATPGFLFNNGNPLGNNIAASPALVGAQTLSNFALGRTNSDLGYGGLVLSASSQSVNILIRALASRRNVRILSRPQVLALDGQQARIQVGQMVPIVDGVNTNTLGVANPLIRQDEAGIILTVQPRISPEGEIVMVVVAEKSAFTGAGVPIFVDTAGNVFESPIKDITNASTTVKVPDGQTIVVGGMITKSDITIERKVPWLGDIPVVKSLFRYDSHTERRTELLMFLTPRIVRGDGDSELIKQVEAERVHFFETEAEAIHGPLFGVPPEDHGLPMMDGQWSQPGQYGEWNQSGLVPQPEAVFTTPRSAPGVVYPQSQPAYSPSPVPSPTPLFP